MKSLTTLIIGIFISIILTGQSQNINKIDSLLTLIESKDKGMGSLSLFKDGKEIYQRSIGYSNIDSKTRANSNTIYRIGSISKTFTATMIMQLIDENKITLQTPLSNFFPLIKNSKTITINHLLRHQSGLYNFTNDSTYNYWMENYMSRDQLLTKVKTYEILFEPGNKMEYSNTNYILLSFIIEDIDNSSYSESLSKRIITKVGLKNTKYGSKIKQKDNEALSYQKIGKWELGTETDMSIPIGAGAIVSTPTDLNLFINALFTQKLTSKKSLKMMQSIEYKFGLGLFEMNLDAKKAIGHTGGIDSFRSNLSYFPAKKFSIAYITNGEDYSMNQLMIGVLSSYFEEEYEFPVFEEEEKLNESDIKNYIGVYSSSELPFDITINKKNGVLIAQATGQPSFTLKYVGEHQFTFDPAGLTMIFNPEKQEAKLIQHGKSLILSQKKK